MSSQLMPTYEDFYQFTLACGQQHTPLNLIQMTLTWLKQYCSYDAACVYIMDYNGQLSDTYLINIDKNWNDMYLTYYASIEAGKYNYSSLPSSKEEFTLSVIDWQAEPDSNFVKEYIHSRGLKFSLNFILYDLKSFFRIQCSLDRHHFQPFSDSEQALIRQVLPLLNVVCQKFYTTYPIQHRQAYLKQTLTKREHEIVLMLCRGITPSNLSKILHISPATTNKHMANIYKKLQVNSIQELLIKLLK